MGSLTPESRLSADACGRPLSFSFAYHLVSREVRRFASQTEIAIQARQNTIVTATQTLIAGKPAATGSFLRNTTAAAGPPRRRSSGLARITQLSQPDSPAGKNAPDKSHIGIRNTLMIA